MLRVHISIALPIVLLCGACLSTAPRFHEYRTLTVGEPVQLLGTTAHDMQEIVGSDGRRAQAMRIVLRLNDNTRFSDLVPSIVRLSDNTDDMTAYLLSEIRGRVHSLPLTSAKSVYLYPAELDSAFAARDSVMLWARRWGARTTVPLADFLASRDSQTVGAGETVRGVTRYTFRGDTVLPTSTFPRTSDPEGMVHWLWEEPFGTAVFVHNDVRDSVRVEIQSKWYDLGAIQFWMVALFDAVESSLTAVAGDLARHIEDAGSFDSLRNLERAVLERLDWLYPPNHSAGRRIAELLVICVGDPGTVAAARGCFRRGDRYELIFFTYERDRPPVGFEFRATGRNEWVSGFVGVMLTLAVLRFWAN